MKPLIATFIFTLFISFAHAQNLKKYQTRQSGNNTTLTKTQPVQKTKSSYQRTTYSGQARSSQSRIMPIAKLPSANLHVSRFSSYYTKGFSFKSIGDSGRSTITWEPSDADEASVGRSSESQEGDYLCSAREVSEHVNNAEHYMLGGTAGLWLGAVLDASKLMRGIYDFNTTDDRVPYVFSIDASNIVGDADIEVADPSLANFRNAQNTLLRRGFAGALSAEMNYTIEDIFEERQLSVYLGAHFSSAAANVAGKFNYDFSSTKTKKLISFKQNYFTLSLDNMSAADYFSGRAATSKDLVISSITYGRLLLFSAETEHTSEALEAALDATFRSPVNRVGIDVDIEHQEVLKNTTIKVYVLGGTASNAVQTITNGVDGIMSFINNGATIDPTRDAVTPIAYRLKFCHNDLNATVVTPTSYTESNCVLNTGKFSINLHSISAQRIKGNRQIKVYGDVALKCMRMQNGRSINLGTSEGWSRSRSEYLTMIDGDQIEFSGADISKKVVVRDLDNLDDLQFVFDMQLYEREPTGRGGSHERMVFDGPLQISASDLNPENPAGGFNYSEQVSDGNWRVTVHFEIVPAN